jgi:hypothetical protein
MIPFSQGHALYTALGSSSPWSLRDVTFRVEARSLYVKHFNSSNAAATLELAIA